MNLRISVKSSGPGLAAAGRQARFALANSINRTLEEAQAENRRLLPSEFTIRSPQAKNFMEQLIRFERSDRATKENLKGRMGIQDLKTKKGGKASFLSKFEEGGEKRSDDPDFPIAIPTSTLRPSFGQRVPPRFYPVNLGLTPRKAIAGGFVGGKIRGKLKTYAITRKNAPTAPPNTLGVWQRRGKRGDTEIFKLWNYKQSVKIPKRISFFDTTRRVISNRFAINLKGFLASALKDMPRAQARPDNRPVMELPKWRPA